MNTFYEQNKFFYHEKYGFRSNSNTATAANNLVCKIKYSLDKGKYCAAIFIDLCEAFDIVNHVILLKKQEASGIRVSSLMLMERYLTNRYQFVKIGNSTSSKQKISTGVPQGSVLGLLLFLVYINDIGKLKLHNEIKLCADDTIIFNSNQDNAEHTFKSPRMKLLTSKTLVIDGNVVKYADSVKYLGLIMDENLKWNKHVNHVLFNILPAVRILKRLRYQGIPVSTR
ncbi:hypothetical protein PR048_009093 [Dryococelus australis]|uniref:Reverse transcriptase domain-containing protein n=1 Tax=Dryococelus australis TaxID=614101 RepID=A0ABQ9HYY4_9NEOP|nr:hypothetical protein PR048_009093 [Dryococelus australis]